MAESIKQKTSVLEQMQKNFWIKNKRGKLVQFKLNKAQQYYWKYKTRRNLILKARQKGLSKVISLAQLIDCLRKSTNAVIISHEKEATKRLFSAVREFIKNMPVKPMTSIDSTTEIKFPLKNSSYYIGTAGQKAFARGDTIDRAHLSEAAFYESLLLILNGLAEACEYGQIDIETTPNGPGDFKDLWEKAKAGKSSYTCIFIPWFIDDEYSVDNLTEKERKGMSQSVQEMINIPDEEFMKTLDDEEKRLIDRVEKEWAIEGVKITPGMLKWRRYKIWDKGQLFYQEYPEDDVSCFLQSGRSVFSQVIVEPHRKVPLDNFDAWNEKQEIKEAMLKRMMYGAVDGAEGRPNGDRHCFSVIDCPPNDKARVIFEITSNDPIDIFWAKVKKVVDKFNIFLGVEKNGLGVAHVEKAKQLGIRFIEWNTGTNRPVMISDLEEGYRKGDLIETYSAAEEELRNVEYNSANKAEAVKGKHDDRVLSRSIAWQMRKMPRPGVTFL